MPAQHNNNMEHAEEYAEEEESESEDDDENEEEETNASEESSDDDDNEEEEEENGEGEDDDGYNDEEPEHFEDEVEPTESGKEYNPDDYEEPTKGRSTTRLSDDGESWRERNRVPLILCLICCLCCIIIAIVIGVVVFPLNKGDDDGSSGLNPLPEEVAPSTPAPFSPVSFPTPPPGPLPPSGKPPPTEFPTISPAPSAAPVVEPTPPPTEYPTISPTISPAPTKSIPETLGIISDQDTMVYLNGPDQGEAYGQDDTFLVQNGPAAFEEIPDSVGLLTFPLNDVPSFDRLTAIKKNVILRLTHEVTTAERGEATYTIVRLPATNMAVETFHGSLFIPPEDTDEGVAVGPSFLVKPEDTTIDIDITSLLFDNADEDQLLLMIQDRGPEQEEGGDRFYSRESSTPPQLLIDFAGGNAADIQMENTNPETPPEGDSTGQEEGGGEDTEGNTEEGTPVPSGEETETAGEGTPGEETPAPTTPAMRRRILR